MPEALVVKILASSIKFSTDKRISSAISSNLSLAIWNRISAYFSTCWILASSVFCISCFNLSAVAAIISSYVDSWHLVGLGSSNQAPVWQPIIGILSLITAGNPQIFLALLMFLTPLILFIFAYKTARSYTLTNYSSVFVASLLELPALYCFELFFFLILPMK
mgnify:CR=1 FL=1